MFQNKQGKKSNKKPTPTVALNFWCLFSFSSHWHSLSYSCSIMVYLISPSFQFFSAACLNVKILKDLLYTQNYFQLICSVLGLQSGHIFQFYVGHCETGRIFTDNNWGTRGKPVKASRYSSSLLWTRFVKGTIRVKLVPNYCLWISSCLVPMLKRGRSETKSLMPKVNVVHVELFSFFRRSGFYTVTSINPSIRISRLKWER